MNPVRVIISPSKAPKLVNQILILGITLLFAAANENILYAQSTAQGTIYSRFGLGERQDFSSSRSQSLGGGANAIRSLDAVNYANPATLSDIMVFRFTAAAEINSLTATAVGLEDSKLSSGYLQALQLSFPLVSRKVGFGLNSTPYTRIAYHVEQGGSFETEPGDGDFLPFGSTKSGNGGLHRISPALGFSPMRNISIGARADIIFGLLEDEHSTAFGAVFFEDGFVTESTRLSGLTGTFGVWYRNTRFLSQGDGIYLGATVTLPTNLSGERVLTTGRGEFADTLASSTVSGVGLPLSVAVNLAYQQSSRVTIVLDGVYEGWSKVTNDDSFRRFPDETVTSYRDRYRFSGGVQYGGSRASDSFSQRLLYRLGVYFDRSYISPSVGTNIDSKGVTAGISIPTIFPGTTIDMNFDYGQTGTMENGLVRDRYFKFGLILNFGERWFARTKLG